MTKNLAIIPDAAHPVVRKPASETERTTLHGRAIFMGPPSLSFDCMRDALSTCGIEADACSFEQGIPACRSQYDVFLLFLVRYDASAQPLIRRRMDELRERTATMPAVALIENADTDAASLRQMGFSTVVAGLPSLRFAVDLVRLVLLSARSAVARAEFIEDANPSSTGLSGSDAGVCFTPREIELLDFLRQGMPNKIIAHELGISQSTVKAHLHNIMAKLHAKNRTHAICLIGQDGARKTPAD